MLRISDESFMDLKHGSEAEKRALLVPILQRPQGYKDLIRILTTRKVNKRVLEKLIALMDKVQAELHAIPPRRPRLICLAQLRRALIAQGRRYLLRRLNLNTG